MRREWQDCSWHSTNFANRVPLPRPKYPDRLRIASTTIVVSFIVSFGVVKAIANLASGHFADVYGRKHMLVLGWLVGLPVPFMIAWGPTWGWVVAANALLGINQGFSFNDGTAAYEPLSGMFRICCLNSLVTMTDEIDHVKVRHTGDVQRNVIEGTYRVIDEGVKYLAAPQDWP